MGEYLNRQGFSALGVRVAGHATCLADLAHSAPGRWLACVEDGFHLLSGLTDVIFLIGLSHGGQPYPSVIHLAGCVGVVAMSTPFPRRRDMLFRFASPLSLVLPVLPKPEGRRGSGGWFGDAWKEHVSYPVYPLRSVCEMSWLLARYRARPCQMSRFRSCSSSPVMITLLFVTACRRSMPVSVAQTNKCSGWKAAATPLRKNRRASRSSRPPRSSSGT